MPNNRETESIPSMSETKHTDSSEQKKEAQAPKAKKAPLKRSTKIVLVCLAAALLAGGAFLAKFIHDIRNPANLFPVAAPAQETPAPTPALNSMAPADPLLPTPSPTPDTGAILLRQADLEFMKNRVNILVLGLDESTEREHWGSFRTDTMILVTIDFETNDVHMISVPRDSYVKICNADGKPTGKFSRVNSAFPSGGGAQKNGYGYAMGTVSYLLGGIPISYYVGFNMNVVKEVVNAMGGVYYNVDTYVYMNGRELFEGYQHLDGQGVLDYCRLRKGSSDLDRIDRQQRMLTEILRQLKSTNQVGNIVSIYQAVESNIQTNLTLKQISSLALLAYDMDIAQLNRTTLPGSGLMVLSRSCIALSPGKIESLVKEIFGVSVSVDSSISAAAIRQRIEENRAAIASELAAAKSALDTANHIISAYGDILPAEDMKQLKSARSKLEDAYEEEEKEALDAYTPPLVQWNSYLLSQIGQSGAEQQPTHTPATPASATQAPTTPESAPEDDPGGQ